jgi:hypothetical protein
LKVGDVVYDRGKDKAQVLNGFFASVFTNEDVSNLPEIDGDGQLIQEIDDLNSIAERKAAPRFTSHFYSRPYLMNPLYEFYVF